MKLGDFKGRKDRIFFSKKIPVFPKCWENRSQNPKKSSFLDLSENSHQVRDYKVRKVTGVFFWKKFQFSQNLGKNVPRNRPSSRVTGPGFFPVGFACALVWSSRVWMVGFPSYCTVSLRTIRAYSCWNSRQVRSIFGSGLMAVGPENTVC